MAWAESFGEFSAGNVAYYLATAFDTICLQPSGDLGLTGIAVERIFLRGALDKLGADFQVGKRHEYKSAAEQLTERGFSAPGQGGDRADDRLGHRAAGQRDRRAPRPRPASRSGELIDARPVPGQRRPWTPAWSTRSATATRSTPSVRAAGRRGRDPALPGPLPARPGPGRAGPQAAGPPRRPAVALIYATGPIRRGRSGRGPLSGGAMGSDTIAAALRTATADDQARAIVLRVNSPGGSYVASDTIWREVVRARGGGQAGGGLDGRRGRLRRLLHRHGRRRDRGPARHDHRLDRRAGGQGRCSARPSAGPG